MMRAKGIKEAVILTSVLLAGSALLFLQLTRGGRLTATGFAQSPTDGAASAESPTPPTLWTETTFYDAAMGEISTRRQATDPGKAYQALLDLGIPALPLLVERLRSGQTCFAPIFEQLTNSGAVVRGPNATTTSRNCIRWWERNKNNWIIPKP